MANIRTRNAFIIHPLFACHQRHMLRRTSYMQRLVTSSPFLALYRFPECVVQLLAWWRRQTILRAGGRLKPLIVVKTNATIEMCGDKEWKERTKASDISVDRFSVYHQPLLTSHQKSHDLQDFHNLNRSDEKGDREFVKAASIVWQKSGGYLFIQICRLISICRQIFGDASYTFRTKRGSLKKSEEPPIYEFTDYDLFWFGLMRSCNEQRNFSKMVFKWLKRFEWRRF